MLWRALIKMSLGLSMEVSMDYHSDPNALLMHRSTLFTDAKWRHDQETSSISTVIQTNHALILHLEISKCVFLFLISLLYYDLLTVYISLQYWVHIIVGVTHSVCLLSPLQMYPMSKCKCTEQWFNSIQATEDGRSMTTFYYCSINHQSGLQRNTFSKLSFFLIH